LLNNITIVCSNASCGENKGDNSENHLHLNNEGVRKRTLMQIGMIMKGREGKKKSLQKGFQTHTQKESRSLQK